ncbi:hypothetical protein WJX73_006411 [Symbiochloris irregularis]|uniref:Uncharacterized protein n=1 Tax=Symbiochloris irregularis TaxID=706552 RepID=A0AAW1PZT8_9CHLO
MWAAGHSKHLLHGSRCSPAVPACLLLPLFRYSQLQARASKSASEPGPWRPSLQDVEKLSKGDAAKKRGTGSRQVPHRLNTDERKLYDLAKEKKFLTLKGSGYRKERKGSPLANIFRQWCDANGQPCIVIQQGTGNDPLDTLVLDLVTLRTQDVGQLQSPCKEIAARMGAIVAEDVSSVIPFTIIVQSPHVEDAPEETSLPKQSPNADVDHMPDISEEAFEELPVWSLPPQAMAFTCQRSTAKQLAAALLDAIQQASKQAQA